ncbi:hypothetical protein QUA74_07135 [Microcoleus sp. LAD1_D3]|uniref:TRADD-N-associated membrane domain-containing protein n=1 Tax=Microcoleus sp. LAD1_D3 TaxID=2819365 RepID=UPI002FD62408
MPNKKLKNNQPSPSDNSDKIERDVIGERLRQAKSSFNATLGLTMLSACLSILGIGMLFSGKIPEGRVTTAGGLASEIVSVQLLKFTKETNDRLDRLAKEFKDDD